MKFRIRNFLYEKQGIPWKYVKSLPHKIPFSAEFQKFPSVNTLIKTHVFSWKHGSGGTKDSGTGPRARNYDEKDLFKQVL
jgi:hypothetical protein